MRRLLGMVMAAFGMSESLTSRELNQAADGLNSLSSVLRSTQPKKYKSKPNRVSQAKRRKYARQGR
ncbi:MULTISPECIES: hypothetical protein [unclassified Acinetobacter]|uniref:hypothetical protein n=1 Tax=unclassified Acinetobacter TaxID=196816 RepID=UPI001D18B40D|nr:MULTISPECIES: hypothetical protein [unclassified Acinetobacter]